MAAHTRPDDPGTTEEGTSGRPAAPAAGDDEADGSSRREPRRTLTERLFASLGESGDVLRRGQGLVAEVAQGTRDELARLVAAEVRGFLNRIDAVDLAQRILDGMSVEVHAELRFRRGGVELARSKIDFGDDRSNEDGARPTRPSEPTER